MTKLYEQLGALTIGATSASGYLEAQSDPELRLPVGPLRWPTGPGFYVDLMRNVIIDSVFRRDLISDKDVLLCLLINQPGERLGDFY